MPHPTVAPADVLTTGRVTELGDARLLPRAEAATARALNRLYAGGTTVRLAVRNVDWELNWCGDVSTQPLDTYRFRLGPHGGRLGLDPLAMAACTGEPRCDRLPRELRYVLLADALQVWAGRLEQATRLRLEWAPAPGGIPYAGPGDTPDGSAAQDDAPAETFDPLRAAGFQAVSAGCRSAGCIQFDDAAAWPALLAALLPAAAAAARPQRDFAWLRIPLPFCLGTTAMNLREIGAVRPGDIISVMTWSTAGSALRVTADIGGRSGCRLIGLAEGSRITLQSHPDPEPHPMNRDLPAPAVAAGDDEASSLPLDRLDALEVSLRFEVGGLSATLGELRGIRAGHVFDLGQPLNRCPVRILAHGNVLGQGHLVAVGDRLGVRVSEFAPHEV